MFDWDFNGIDENGQTDGKLVFVATKDDYDTEKYVPGIYTVTVNGRAIKSDPQLNEQTTFQIELKDPCDPPTQINVPNYANQHYTLTSTALTVPKQAFTASRGDVTCPVTVSDIQYTKLPDGRTSIVENANDWSIFWDTDDYPLTRSETVNVVVTSTSKHGTSNTPLTASDDFIVNFSSPCEDSTLTTISSTTQTNPDPDSYSGDDFFFTYKPYTVSPDYCDLQISCQGVEPVNQFVPCQEIVDGKLTFNFPSSRYTNQEVPPGDYTFTFQVSTDPTNPALTEEFTVTVTLEDPCKTPTV